MRFVTKDNSTLRNVINMKYGTEEEGWFPIIPRSSYKVGWEEISKEVTHIKQFCSIVLGDGCKTRFWKDLWCGEVASCTSFPSLNDVTGSKGAKVADLKEISRSKGGWNFKFERHFNNKEMEVVQIFLGTINSKSCSPQLRDKLW